MTDREKFLVTLRGAANASGCPFPDYQAAEAALESNFGESQLFKIANNPFGAKQRKAPVYETISLPTNEYINGQWIRVPADWIKYPDLASAMKHRMYMLQVLSKIYPDYKKALASTIGENFVINVSRTWATDPNRADKVLAIYNKYRYLFDAPITTELTKIIPDPPANTSAPAQTYFQYLKKRFYKG